MQHRLRMTARY